MDNSLIFSNNCTTLIADSEGFSSVPYVDPGTGDKPYTIGFGTTIYCNGTGVTMSDPAISRNQGLINLLCHLNLTVLPCIQNSVTSDVNQNNLDALGSLVYNIGCGNFKSSTVLRLVNQSPIDLLIKDAFDMWNKGNGKVLSGLVIRRKRESDLYFTPIV